MTDKPDQAAPKAKSVLGEITMKVSEKGALSLYGLGRFPVTLYKEQWARVLDKADEIRKFVKSNDEKLKTKAAVEKGE